MQLLRHDLMLCYRSYQIKRINKWSGYQGIVLIMLINQSR